MPPPIARTSTSSGSRPSCRLTKERLQATIEELESTNEELKSSNEEYQSINEELQSSNEELETSKEELQSRQRGTGDRQRRAGAPRRRSSARANSDLKNLLEKHPDRHGLPRQRSARHATSRPPVTEIFHLIETDIGRPSATSPRGSPMTICRTTSRKVLRTLAPVEREMVSARATGSRYIARVCPTAASTTSSRAWC